MRNVVNISSRRHVDLCQCLIIVNNVNENERGCLVISIEREIKMNEMREKRGGLEVRCRGINNTCSKRLIIRPLTSIEYRLSYQTKQLHESSCCLVEELIDALPLVSI